MFGADDLITLVGPAAGKLLLKVWLGDKEVAAEAGSGILDILGKKGGDALAQRRGERQFQAIGERVAETLLPVFYQHDVSDEGRERVAKRITQTLERSTFDPSMIARADFDPHIFAAHLVKQNLYAERGLSEPEVKLLHRVVREVAAGVIDVSSRLPSFTEKTIAELLRRDTDLIARSDYIIAEIKKIREGVASAADHSEAKLRFEEDYRRAVVRKYDHMELFGVDLSGPSKRHPLSVAYVTLSASQAAANDTLDMEVSPPSPESDDQAVSSVAYILCNRTRLVVRGDAGSGKTTLLRWLGVNSVRRSFSGEMVNWNDCVPFFIPLRRFAGTDLPMPETFAQLTVPTVSGTMPIEWVHEMLETGRAILLIDGVDEVPESRRASVRRWLTELVETFPSTRYVVTSRPAAISTRWLGDYGFAEADLLPMTIDDIAEFVKHWHVAVSQVVAIEDERAELPELGQHLTERIRENKSLRSLATNPLLCAVICALHRDRNRKLPRNRVELYEACFSMLLDRRDRERSVSIEAHGFPQLSYSEKRVVLEELAYSMMLNEQASISGEKAEKIIQRRLAAMPQLAGVSASDLRRLLVERSGLLREPAVDVVDFTHRTFQEFLCAKAAMDFDNVDFLIRQGHSDYWREVVILAAGIASSSANPQSTNHLVGGLLMRGYAEPKYRHQLHLLAIACLETVIQIDPDIQASVVEALASLIPPTNVGEAKAIASAGELAVPFLVRSGQHYVQEAVACVRALALIGGDDALNALTTYTVDSRRTVTRELVRAADMFEASAYLDAVLSKIQPEELTLQRSATLTGISSLTSLKTLYVRLRSDVESLEPLVALQQLENLFISSEGRPLDIWPIGELAKLTSLSLGIRGTMSVEPIGRLEFLTSLTLHGCELLAELTGLEGLGQLSELRLLYLPELIRLPDLSRNRSLVDLSLYSLPKLDISCLSKYEHLRSLRINRLVFEELPELSANQLSSIDLQMVYTLRDIGAIASTENVSRVLLSSLPEVTDLSLLDGLHKLRFLSLQSMPNVKDLTFLERCQAIESLYITRSDVPLNFAMLRSMRSLRRVRLAYVPNIVDLSMIYHMPNVSFEIVGPNAIPTDIVRLPNVHVRMRLDLHSIPTL